MVTDKELEVSLEGAIRLSLMEQAINLCFYYYFSGEFTPKEASRELSHYQKQVIDWELGKELPGWAKDD